MDIHALSANVARHLATSAELQHYMKDRTGKPAAVYFPAIGSEALPLEDGPVVVVSPSHESKESGGRSRDVRVSVSLRTDSGGTDGSKPFDVDGVRMLWAGGIAELSETILEALQDAPVGSRLEGWDSDFDFDAYPLITLETTLHYSDQFAY